MITPSRTPEGDGNRCPVCGKETRVEPSTVPTRDAPCPHCGCLLWFSQSLHRSLSPSRQDVTRLAEEIACLSGMHLTPAEYYGEFLMRLLTAIVAPAGAVWLRTPEGDLRLQYQINMRQTGILDSETSRQMHDELLRDAVVRGQPASYPPLKVFGDPRAWPVEANPTPYVILMAPIVCDKHVIALVEIWQEPSRGPDSQRGFLQFMVRMTGLAAGYTKRAAETQ